MTTLNRCRRSEQLRLMRLAEIHVDAIRKMGIALATAIRRAKRDIVDECVVETASRCRISTASRK